MLAIVCPGQGAQTPGFLSPWLELPSVARRLDELSEAAGLDLLTHGTVSDAETIKDTAVAQPLIVAASLLTAHALFGGGELDGGTFDGGVPAGAVLAGHSVGEIPAAALAGVLSEADAMLFVRERATGMATAAAAAATGMSAVVGGKPEEVLAAIEAAGLTAANMNSVGQTVAAGTLKQLETLAANPPAKARVIPLPVAGAFHTHHMSPAVSALEALRPRLSANDPAQTLLSNFDGQPVAEGDAVMTSLIAQVSRPVRWDLCMETMLSMGVTALIELSPAGTLTGLAKRAMPNVATVALKTPADLDSARELIARTRDLAAGPTGQEEGHQ
ncbi:ACP S-malonyltransferase [Paenarthrobacter sp. Z7-10]|uniref:ACP S-malonyltransferase n=1 Tax=Paenarthrobacter sp. Z7-10 TaxID=2787635 RepID=UPI0022A9A032|nr:ACP S-malonyltransferase [Paenarthrobacter sp. Z7-10]MCZ2404930.1 ACP S-malonyltransferase [Paenarthrobacter sp. Z7-10]